MTTSSQASARVLVVEDEIITARDLQDSLEDLGYDVPDIASTGDEALDLAAEFLPDLVLMDINLGASGCDGVDVARELYTRFGVPVIYLTAYADPATLNRASTTAPLGYLTKPFDRRELHATIQMALVKRQLDEQIRQSENWYSTSLSSIGDGVIATDADGRVKFLNPAAEALTGWALPVALGRPLEEVFALSKATTGEPIDSLAARVLADNQTIFLEEGARLCTRGGTFVPIGDSAAPIRDQRDGSVLGVVIVFTDLREKQQIAAELERARRLESLGTLAGGLAHDLNNILAIIAGNASLASQTGVSADVQARAFGEIDIAVRRATGLTGQFLTFSKGGEPIRRDTDIPALLAEKMNTAFAETPAGVEHALEIAGGLWTVSADEKQIHQVVENLLRNAIKALPAAGGRITVRASNCAREDLPPRSLGDHGSTESHATHFVVLEIVDTGCGIPVENLARVCEPYFTTWTVGGGLGLSVCYSIARKHAGFLRIQSVVGQGTSVAIYLPASLAKEAPVAAGRQGDGAPAAGPVPSEDDDKLHVLVMDDEPMMLELLHSMLGFLGHSTVTAQTGEEALRLYRAAATVRPFDAVCIDLINKVGMGGQEMIGRLRQFDPAAVALVCSGYSDHPIMANYQKYGFRGCLPKPVSLEQLEVGLRQAVSGRV